jgi:hypothetical protein
MRLVHASRRRGPLLAAPLAVLVAGVNKAATGEYVIFTVRRSGG